MSSADALDGFSTATRAWFEGAFAVPTQAQAQAWRAIGEGRGHAGHRADRVGQDAGRVPVGDRPAGGAPPPSDKNRRCRVVYVSPLKALAVDIERNLRSPLIGIGQAARRLGCRSPRSRWRCGPVTPPPTSGASSPRTRPTSSSPPPSRSSCCSPRRRGRPCAGSRRSSWTRCTRSRAPSAARTWRCRSNGSTRCAAPPAGGPAGRPVGHRAPAGGGGDLPGRGAAGHGGAPPVPSRWNCRSSSRSRTSATWRARPGRTARTTRCGGGRSGRTSRSGCST